MQFIKFCILAFNEFFDELQTTHLNFAKRIAYSYDKHIRRNKNNNPVENTSMQMLADSTEECGGKKRQNRKHAC